MLTDDDKATLYGTLVDICQAYGFTTEATYDLLHEVVESIVDDDPEARTADATDDDDEIAFYPDDDN